MKTLLLSVAMLGLCAGLASAQVTQPAAPPTMPLAEGAPAAVTPPPPPPGGDRAAGPMAPAPHGPGAGRETPPPPPPPPSRAAHFRLENGGTVLDVRCADDEPMQTCADIALQLLDHASGVPTAARP